MAITPDEIENRVFPLVRRGYDPAEVDNFLKDVATTLAQAQGGLATPPAAPVAAPAPAPVVAPVQPDDFEQLGEEVAAVLRQAHQAVADLRHRAEAEAALIRQDAQREVEELTRRADADRQAAAIELEAARGESERLLEDAQRRTAGVADAAAVAAEQRVREVIEAARAEARGAVLVQRNVRGRLEDTRDHIDQALDRLIEEDTDLFATIDLTDGKTGEAGDGDFGGDDDGPDDDGGGLVPPPGQGPPTPPVPPPPGRTTPIRPMDLPYAEEGDDDDDTLVVDLTDEDPDDDGGGLGAVVPDQPDDGGAPAEGSTVIGNEAESDDDALSQMVKNAVENALRRRKGDGEPPAADPT